MRVRVSVLLRAYILYGTHLSARNASASLRRVCVCVGDVLYFCRDDAPHYASSNRASASQSRTPMAPTRECARTQQVKCVFFTRAALYTRLLSPVRQRGHTRSASERIIVPPPPAAAISDGGHVRTFPLSARLGSARLCAGRSFVVAAVSVGRSVHPQPSDRGQLADRSVSPAEDIARNHRPTNTYH